jgi:hypothetical protein
MWISFTEDDLKQAITGPELAAIQTAALATGQTDPVPGAVADAIQLVRGKIAACLFNYLGDQNYGEIIPQELRNATLNLARYFACSRVPAGLVNAERKQEYANALKLLDDVAGYRFRLELPAHMTPQIISGPAMAVARVAPERASREQMRGL